MNRFSQGFTLIELLISVTIGSLVVYTALAGVRVASGAMTASNRIAMENELLRVGFVEALQEVDFWINSDNPGKAGEQPFRAFDNTLGGMSFSSFLDKNDDTGTGQKFIDKTLDFDEPIPGGPLMAIKGGWNPHPLARCPANPRTWTRNNYFDEGNAKHPWGTSFIYTNLDSSIAPHYWQAGQIKNIIDTMGFWGLIEYLPSNTLFGYHGRNPLGSTGSMQWTGTSSAFTQNGLWFCPSDGGDHMMKGRYRNTNGSRYALPGPKEGKPQRFRQYYDVGYGGRNRGFSQNYLDDFLTATKVEALDAETRMMPEMWPRVQFAVRRIIIRGQFVNSVVISCQDPKSGNAFEIPFVCTGTTLRGARQQRDPKSGWAIDEYKGPSLDYPQIQYDQLVETP
jgi:prepilin-type N-terminal cleavage/methylation domain-containing protein